MNPQKIECYKAAWLVCLPTVLLSLVVTPLAAGAASGTFAVTGSLNTPRTNHTATLLQSGEVLVAGGYDLNGPLTSAELYNPAKGTWSLTGTMVFAHNQGFTATLLPNGEVLVAGGLDSSTEFCLSEAELYNPPTGRWTATASMNEPRCGHTATLLSTGDVLVASGATEYGTVAASAELYNPTTGEWQTTGSVNNARESGGAALLADGQVLLAGGFSFQNLIGSIPVGVTTAELYNPSSGGWSMTTSPVGGANPSNVLLGNGDVLFTNQFYNPATGSWTATGPTPRQAVGPHVVTMLPTGDVLGTGNTCHYSGCGGVPAIYCFLYTPSTNSWSLTGSMHQARANHTATLLLNGKVLVAGGSDRISTTTTVLSSAELYTP
jgi:hypothetical protein